MKCDREEVTVIKICDCDTIHPEKVEQAKEYLLEESVYNDLSLFYKAFGDYNRLRMLSVLRETELCVCDLANLLDMTQSAISHQLRLLKQAKLVKYRKEGKVVYYSLDDEHVNEVFSVGLHHILHTKK
jgi:DNA-binding transcriptional ArsR family regulator